MTVQFFRALQRSNELREHAKRNSPPPHRFNDENVRYLECEANAITPGNQKGRQPKWKK